MSNNFFNDDDDGSDFRDIPDEVSGQPAFEPQVRVNRPAAPPAPAQQAAPEPEVEEFEEAQEEESEEQDFASILSDARQRMEQGRIYEVIMDHDLFSGQGFDEKAVKYVTRQIRNFAKEQMEIMLGMRQETPKASAMQASDFPFNDVEVAALKDLAYMATKGKSADPEVQTFSGAPSAPATPRKAGINPIGVKTAHKAAPAKPAPKAAAPQKPLAKTPAKPVKRDPKTEAAIERILQEEGISREEYERQYPPDYKPLSKPLSQMNEQEIAEWRRQEALKNKKAVKSFDAKPMPSVEQENMLHMSRAQEAASHPQMQTLMLALTGGKKPQT